MLFHKHSTVYIRPTTIVMDIGIVQASEEGHAPMLGLHQLQQHCSCNAHQTSIAPPFKVKLEVQLNLMGITGALLLQLLQPQHRCIVELSG